MVVETVSTSYGSSTSSTLLRRAASNEPAAWETLVNLCHPLVYGWVQYSGWQHADVENVVQEVFATVATKLPDFQSTADGSFRGWLKAIVRSKVVDYARKRKKDSRYQIDLEVEVDSLSSSEAKREARQMYVRVLQLIRREINERDWLIFWRKEVEGATARQVADELSLSVAAVYSVIARLRKHIRQYYGDFLE